MTREDIIRMAREAGCKPFRSPEHWDDVQVFATPDVLERFAALVAEHEREACAELAVKGTDEPVQTKTLEILRKERERFAAAIRARSEK